MPVSIANGLMPWKVSGLVLGRRVARALGVTAWMITGPSTCFAWSTAAVDRRDVVPVDRPDVLEPEFLEEHPGDEQLLDRLLGRFARRDHRGTESGRPRARLDIVAQAVVAGVEPHASQIGGERTHVLGDRHLVVVEHDDEPCAADGRCG